jgi:hypothetical protein
MTLKVMKHVTPFKAEVMNYLITSSDVTEAITAGSKCGCYGVPLNLSFLEVISLRPCLLKPEASRTSIRPDQDHGELY